MPAITPASEWLKPLDTSDKFAKLVKTFNTRLSDDNISTGTTVVYSAELAKELPKSADAGKELAKQLFFDVVKEWTNQDLPEVAKVTVTWAKMKDVDVDRTALSLAEGYAYYNGNEADIDRLRRQTWKLVRALGEPNDIQYAGAKARLLHEVTESMKWVRTHAFINRATGKLFLVFTVEGTI